MFSEKTPFSVTLRALRQSIELSQKEFASRYDIPLNEMQAMEAGTRQPESAQRLLINMVAIDPAKVAELIVKNKALQTAKA